MFSIDANRFGLTTVVDSSEFPDIKIKFRLINDYLMGLNVYI